MMRRAHDVATLSFDMLHMILARLETKSTNVGCT